jgi:hypothetical protein
MLEFAQQFEALTAEDTDPAIAVLYDRMKAHPLHLLGTSGAPGSTPSGHCGANAASRLPQGAWSTA